MAKRLVLSILNWRRYDLTAQLLDSLLGADTGGAELQIVVIDNESPLGDAEIAPSNVGSFEPSSARSLAEHPLAPLVICNEANRGYSGGFNTALRQMDRFGADHVAVVNNDALVEKGTLPPLLETADTPGVGFVGPVNLWGDGSVQTSGIRIDLESPYVTVHEKEPFSDVIERRALQGSFLVASADTLRTVGLLDECFFYTWEDTDWTTRATEMGLRNLAVAASSCTHAGTESLGGADGYNPVVEYMLMRNMLVYLDRRGRATPAEIQHVIDVWHERCERDTFRHPGFPPADPDIARTTNARAVADFRAGRLGRWPKVMEQADTYRQWMQEWVLSEWDETSVDAR